MKPEEGLPKPDANVLSRYAAWNPSVTKKEEQAVCSVCGCSNGCGAPGNRGK